MTLITGSGSGIGKSTALLFGKEGASVIVNDLDAVKGEETARQIRDNGGNATFIQANVTDPESVQELVRLSYESFGRIDALFNNAGISGVGAIHEIEPVQWDRVMSVNVRGARRPKLHLRG